MGDRGKNRSTAVSSIVRPDLPARDLVVPHILSASVIAGANCIISHPGNIGIDP